MIGVSFLTRLRKGLEMTKTEDESNALSVIDQRAEAARKELPAVPTPQQEMAAMLGGGLLRELHTFKGNQLEVWAKIQEASSGDVIKISDHLNLPIDLVGFYVHEVDLQEEPSGEIPRAIRTVLYDANGKRYACVSDGIAKDIWRLMQYGLIPSEENPLKIKVVQVSTKGPNRTYRITQYKE